jgi:molecular chaperone GrpE
MADENKKSDGEVKPEEAQASEAVENPLGDESPAIDSEVVSLRGELDSKVKEAKENYDRFLRQVAELDNFKKRMARDKEDAIRLANEALTKDLLPIVDNLERAVEHAKGDSNENSLVEGVEMVLKGFLDVLNKHGVTQLSAVGEPFDPEKHEAMAHVESETHKPNTVVEEHHKGYFLHDRLLRPSLVSVAKAPETKEKKKEEAEVEKGSADD